MAFAETAPLIAALKLDDKFSGPLKKASRALGQFDAKLDHTQGRAYLAGQQIGTGIKNTARIAAVGVGILVSQVALGLNSLVKLEQAQAQTAAVLKSTGGAAGQTGDDITRLSEKFEGLNATVGDEFVRAGANMLLTFTNIKGKAFEPALAATLDMNTALGKGPEGLTGTAILVGKALNDPIRGLTALRRVGVSFTADQEKQIKSLVKQNKLFEAQGIIIGEVNREFQGSFLAQGNTTAGRIAKFTDSIDDLQRELARALLPTLGNVADALTKTLQDPAVIKGVGDIGKGLANLVSPANLASAGQILQDVFAAARSAAPVLLAAAEGMGKVISAAVGIFKSLPPEIQKIAIGALAVNKLTGGLVTNVAGGILGGIAKGGLFSRGSTRANPLFVADVGGLGGKVGGLAGLAGAGLAVGTGTALVVIAAGVAASVISTLPFLERNNALGDKGLNSAEIAALKYYESDAAAQQAALKHLGRIPSRADYDSALAKLGRTLTQTDERPGRKTGGAIRPTSVDSIRTTPADLAAINAAMARGRAAGYKPTFASAQETLQRNISRAAEAALTKQDAIKAAILSTDTRSELAGIRNAVSSSAQKPPITNVGITVNVTAGGIVTTVTKQKRFGPPVGSRQSDAGHFGGAGT